MYVANVNDHGAMVCGVRSPSSDFRLTETGMERTPVNANMNAAQSSFTLHKCVLNWITEQRFIWELNISIAIEMIYFEIN